MAGQKSGKAPGQTPYAPGGAEVWSDSDHDYFKDTQFNREGSLNQIRQRDQDVDRLYKEKDAERSKRNAATVDSINDASEKAKQYTPSYAKGGIVGPNRLKWGSPKVSAPCKDTKTIKCY
jgi:hypothetical protein